MTKTITGMLLHKLAADKLAANSTRTDAPLPLDANVVDAFPPDREPAWLAAWRADARKSIKVSDLGSSYLWASVGDWGRLGQLMLNDGLWGGVQVLPPGWLQRGSAKATLVGEGRGYGAHSWRIGDPDSGKCKGRGVPADALAMSGHLGQIVAMVPSREAVIVRMG